MALLIIGCNKSDDRSDGSGKEKNEATDYTLLIDDDGILSSTLLNADANLIEISSDKSAFDAVGKPQLTFEDGGTLSMYQKKADCSGSIVIHDFNENTSKSYSVFTDMPSCNRNAKAIANTGIAIYIAYESEISEEESNYFLRVIDITTPEATFVDVELELQPVELAFASNRLFILTFDGNSSEDYKLFVMNAETLDIIHGMELGLDVKRIFRNPEGNIIIGYPNLHTTLNSSTMAFEYTNYGEYTEPNFFHSQFRQFDTEGKMYYDMPPGSISIYPIVAAIYNFETNNTVLYAYENFLTETQRDFEYGIKSTTMVGYDEKNNLLLIGYSKTGGSKKGGLLRIKLGLEPEFVDNIDLDGTPYALFVK